MSSILKIVDLSHVMPYKSAWSVEVKILHKWISFSHQSGASIELVLSDQNGVKIHASCKQSLMPQLERHLTVGDWKVITNFLLSKSYGLNRTTNHVYKMEFVGETQISVSNVRSDDLFLNVHDFAYILNGLHDNSYLIDVVGEVLDLGGRSLVACARKEIDKLEFTLRDVKNLRMHCCITGRLATMLTTGDKKLSNGDICLLRFARVELNKDEFIVSNYFGYSLVLINPNIREAEALKQMFHSDKNILPNDQPKLFDVQERNKRIKWSSYPFTTIQGLKRSSQGETQRVICHVYAIDTMSGWYYFACVVCNKQVFKPQIVFDELNLNNWWCEFCQCNVQKVSPRYKLTLLVQDQTGEATFSLVDSAANFIVKASAAKVIKNLPNQGLLDNHHILPPQLVDVVGKTYGFGISIGENNSSSLAEYKTLKIWTLDDIIQKQVKALHQSSTSSRKKQCMEVGEDDTKDFDNAERK